MPRKAPRQQPQELGTEERLRAEFKIALQSVKFSMVPNNCVLEAIYNNEVLEVVYRVIALLLRRSFGNLLLRSCNCDRTTGTFRLDTQKDYAEILLVKKQRISEAVQLLVKHRYLPPTGELAWNLEREPGLPKEIPEVEPGPTWEEYRPQWAEAHPQLVKQRAEETALAKPYLDQAQPHLDKAAKIDRLERLDYSRLKKATARDSPKLADKIADKMSPKLADRMSETGGPATGPKTHGHDIDSRVRAHTLYKEEERGVGRSVEAQSGPAPATYLPTDGDLLSLPSIRRVVRKINDTPGPKLAQEILASLRGAPLIELDSRVTIRFKSITSFGLVKHLADDVGKVFSGLQSNADEREHAVQQQKQNEHAMAILRENWDSFTEEERSSYLEIYPELAMTAKGASS